MRRAVAVLAKGNIRHIAREDQPMPVYSLTKPLIATAVLASGIDVQTPASHWIAAEWLPEGQHITVEHLLLHRSGIRDYGAHRDYKKAIESGRPWQDHDFANITTRRPLLFEPGTGFAYSNPGYWLLTRILQLHTGQTLSDAIQKLVFEPLALHHTRFVSGQFAADLPDYPAEWVWHGLVMSTTRDMLTFMASDRARELTQVSQPVGEAGAPWKNPHYGYGMMIEPGLAYGHNGNGPGYSASCFHFPARSKTICVLEQSEVDDAAFATLCDLDWH